MMHGFKCTPGALTYIGLRMCPSRSHFQLHRENFLHTKEVVVRSGRWYCSMRAYVYITVAPGLEKPMPLFILCLRCVLYREFC